MITSTTRQKHLMAEINIIPLVDVVLVLLIIFMVTAPLMDRGIDLTLPQSATNTITPEKRNILTIGKNQVITLNDETLSMSDLKKRLRSMQGASIDLKADQSVPYGVIVSVIDLIKQSGIDKLGIITDPLISKKGPSS